MCWRDELPKGQMDPRDKEVLDRILGRRPPKRFTPPKDQEVKEEKKSPK